MIAFVETMATITEPLGNLGRTVQVQDYSPGAALEFFRWWWLAIHDECLASVIVV